ncbi:MAG: sulfatase-like hydrolase/transferase [Spirochaetaceae bacterium]
MKKKNVIFIICDELRADSLGFMGNKQVKTPNLDKLASDSLIIEKAYCSSPMCCPSRASLATGRHPLTHGVLDNGLHMMEDEVSLYGILRDSGYNTVNIGKWHINSKHDTNFGMNTNITQIKCEDQKINPFGITDSELRKKTTYKKMHGDISLAIHGQRPIKAEESLDSLYTDEFIKEIEKAKQSVEPSFLRLSLLDPHSPYMPCKPYSEMYNYKDIELPVSFNSNLETKPLMHKLFHKIRGFDHLVEDDYKKCKASYYGLISHVDYRIGKVIDSLKELDMYDNSLIIFTSDHGSMMGEHGYIEKWGYMYEEVSKIPFIIKFPKEEELEGRSDTFMENIDIMPTILDYLGVDIPENIHGKSLIPYIKNRNEEHRTEVHGLSYIGGFQDEPALMIRDDIWKLTIYPGQESLENGLNNDHYLRYSDFFDGKIIGGELYNLNSDPFELNNLFCDENYKSIKNKYVKKIDEWKKSLGPIVDYKGMEPLKNSLAFFSLSQGDMLSETNNLILSNRLNGNIHKRGRNSE